MTAEEIEHLLLHGDAGGYGTERTLHTTLCAQAIAALVAERMAAAVEAAVAEERQRIESGFSVRSEMLAKWLGEYIEADDKPAAYQRMLDSIRAAKTTAVDEARAQEREACAAYVQSRADAQAAVARDAIRLGEPRIAGTAENRAALLTDVAAHLLHGDDFASGQSEAPAPATPAARPGGGGELDEGWLCRTIADETGCKDDERVLDAARAIATRLRACEARVRALVEAARAYVMHTLTTGVVRCCVPKRDALCAAIDAIDALGKEGT